MLYPILCALTTIFVHIPYFCPVSPFKIFPTICSPQYCSSQCLLARMNFLSLFHSTVLFYKPELFPFAFLILTAFLFSFLEQSRHLFLCLSSIPQQLFSLSLTLFWHFLSICHFLILHQPAMVGQATTLDETQENMSPAIMPNIATTEDSWVLLHISDFQKKFDY